MTRILTFLFFLISFGISAQVNDLYLPTGSGNALKVNRVATNRYVVVGHSYGKAYAYKVNQLGQPVKIKHFKHILGGTRSAFTDMVFNNGFYYMAGYCEDCVTGDPGRKIVVVKTDSEFKTLAIQKLDSPAPSSIDEPLGWSKIEADGNNIVVMSQLALLADVFGGSSTDTLTNFALTRMDADLAIDYHRRYDYAQYDNIGDLKVANGKYYAMAWNPNYGLGQPLYGIGMEETALHVIDPATGDIQNTWDYDGVGLVLSDIANSTDLAIGGARTTSLQAGPQSSITRINSTTGAIINETTFGNNNRVDAIVELQPLTNGNLLASGAMNMAYPNLNQLLNGSITNFNQLVNPRDARVYRIDGTTLGQIGGEVVLPKPTNATNIMLYSLLPLSPDGINWLGVGYRLKNSYFHSRLPVPACRPIDGVLVAQRTDDELAEAVEIAIYPNPAIAGEGAFVNVQGDLQVRSYVQAFDVMGRMVEQSVIDAAGQYNILQTAKPGIYSVIVVDASNEIQSYKIVIE